MIVGLGIDIVELYRIKSSVEKFGLHFIQKILHPLEISARKNLPHSLDSAANIAFLASRFAAKEACVKALGTGFSNGISLHHIQVISLPSGQPKIKLSEAAEVAFNNMATTIHLSISHGKDNAVAVVILEKLHGS